MNIFMHEDNPNYSGLVAFSDFERMRHRVHTNKSEKWTFNYPRNRFISPSGARVQVVKIKDMDDCYQLAGMEFQNLLLADHIPSPMVDYLKGRVRSAYSDIGVGVSYGDRITEKMGRAHTRCDQVLNRLTNLRGGCHGEV